MAAPLVRGPEIAIQSVDADLFLDHHLKKLVSRGREIQVKRLVIEQWKRGGGVHTHPRGGATRQRQKVPINLVKTAAK